MRSIHSPYTLTQKGVFYDQTNTEDDDKDLDNNFEKNNSRLMVM